VTLVLAPTASTSTSLGGSTPSRGVQSVVRLVVGPWALGIGVGGPAVCPELIVVGVGCAGVVSFWPFGRWPFRIEGNSFVVLQDVIWLAAIVVLAGRSLCGFGPSEAFLFCLAWLCMGWSTSELTSAAMFSGATVCWVARSALSNSAMSIVFVCLSAASSLKSAFFSA
jgi:hypothetical protein